MTPAEHREGEARGQRWTLYHTNDGLIAEGPNFDQPELEVVPADDKRVLQEENERLRKGRVRRPDARLATPLNVPEVVARRGSDSNRASLERAEELEEQLLDVALALTRLLTTNERRHSLDEILERFEITREELDEPASPEQGGEERC